MLFVLGDEDSWWESIGHPSRSAGRWSGVMGEWGVAVGQQTCLSWGIGTKIKNKGAFYKTEFTISQNVWRFMGWVVEEPGHWKHRYSWFLVFVVAMVYHVVENMELMNIEQCIGLRGTSWLDSWESQVNQSIWSLFNGCVFYLKTPNTHTHTHFTYM